ncbi:MAG: hypothetical protein ABJL72_12195 [Roseobacter sp.]
MANTPRAIHPIKDKDGKPIKPGDTIDLKRVGAIRLGRLIKKGRVTEAPHEVLENRAEEAGRPDLKSPPEPKDKFGQ